jgi:hypothetical protein
MVNVARMMGLAMDPDEFPGKYSFFEAETRRRIWMDIFCYNLCVPVLSICSRRRSYLDLSLRDTFLTLWVTRLRSPTTRSLQDCPSKLMRTLSRRGLRRFLPPTLTIVPGDISVLSCGTRCNFLFSPAPTYILNLRRMAQIVKSVKKRTFKDPLTDSPSSDSASIKEAAAFEVAQFLTDLPLAFKLEIDADLSTLAASVSSTSLFSSDSPERSSSSACLITQQCQLVITGQRLILKIYLPFLRPSHTSATCNTNYQATVGTINVTHAIMYASRRKQSPGSQSKQPGPAIFDYYSFGRALFDAAVVCAHSVIIQHSAIWARVALDDCDVVDALKGDERRGSCYWLGLLTKLCQ